ncbi:MAG: DUF4124 domain-containing protein [Thiohalobacterales bacterium]
MHVLTKTAIIFISLCLSHGVSAEKIYRSVDKKGEVTFSDEPPPSAVNIEQVEIQPAPTESEYRESVERVQRMESQAGERPAQMPARRPAGRPSAPGGGGGGR